MPDRLVDLLLYTLFGTVLALWYATTHHPLAFAFVSA